MDNYSGKNDLNRASWEALRSLSGFRKHDDYVVYLMILLFIRHVSRFWKAGLEKYKKIYSDDHERIMRKMARTRFLLPVLSESGVRAGDGKNKSHIDFESICEHLALADCGEYINQILKAFVMVNTDKLDGLFKAIDFNSDVIFGHYRERNKRLRRAFEMLNITQTDDCLKLDHEITCAEGNAGSYVIDRAAVEGNKAIAAQHTPYFLAKLLAKISHVKAGDRICDPFCGSASILLAMAREVQSHNYALYGKEKDRNTRVIAMLRLFMNGIDSVRIDLGNSITNPLYTVAGPMKFDILATQIPFKCDNWGWQEAEYDRFNRFWRGLPPKSRGDFAYICHMIEVANEKTGKVIVIVPPGVLFRGGPEAGIRKRLIEENSLDAVIGLPTNMFAANTMPVAILVFDRSREKNGANETMKDVLIIDASRNFDRGIKHNTLSDNDIDMIANTCANRTDVSGYARKVSICEIREKGFNLNISKYIDVGVGEEKYTFDQIQQDIESLEKSIVNVRNNISKLTKNLGVNNY